MAQLDISHCSPTIPKAPEPIKPIMGPTGPDGKQFPVAYRGDEVWIPAVINFDSEYQYVYIEGSFNYERNEANPNELRVFSKSGFWLPVKDKSSGRMKFGEAEYQYSADPRIQIRNDHWAFGQKSCVEFVLDTESRDAKLDFVIGAVPYFNVADSPLECILTIKISGVKFGQKGVPPQLINKYEIKYSLDDNMMNSSNEAVLQIFNDFEAFNLKGDGNSIHPKQLCTQSALKSELSRFKENVKIAYIGADTTENICSLIRILESENSLSSKIERLTIYLTEDWDQLLIQRFPDLEIEYNNQNGLINLEKCVLPEDGTLPKNIHPADITIATYVAPWAISGDNENQYAELLQNLMSSKDSTLISVDPMSPNHIVRSQVSDFNLPDFYKGKLNLKNKKHRFNNPSAEAEIWSNKEVSS